MELQEGLAVSLQSLIGRILANRAHMQDKQNGLGERDLNTLVNAAVFMNYLSTSTDLSRETRDQLYRFHLETIAKNKELRTAWHVDITRHSWLMWVRAQLYANLVTFALPDVTGAKLSTLAISQDRKAQIAAALALKREYLAIWKSHLVLVIDNDGLDKRQLAVIHRVLELVPAELHDTAVITVGGFLGEKIAFLTQKVGSVNIFGTPVGTAKDNAFPDDVSPRFSELFIMALIHELNHIVDAYYVDPNNPDRGRLIKQAGKPSMNYLRSMVPEGFFVTAPQEFFASISNAYFNSSKYSLALALKRFQSGYKEPLNQFLFFANVYSLKGEYTRFFTTDAQGNIECQKIPLTRDERGCINSLRIGTNTLRFTLDENGNVTDFAKK